jgi:hypothetical protein
MTNNILKEKLEGIIKLVNECLVELGADATPKTTTAKPAQTSTNGSDKDLPLKITNKISDCDEADLIQTRILDKRDREGRVLLCLYISHKYFGNTWLTTGDIEKITSELGVKIDISNVTKAVKSLRLYIESGSVRKKGQPTPLRLNRKGIKRFEEIIHVKEN